MTETASHGLETRRIGDDVLYDLTDTAAHVTVTVAPSLGGQVIGMSA